MLTKDSKIKVLENFYGIDYTLLGKPVSEVGVCCPFFLEEYMSVKGALMSVVIEMYKLIDHAPKPIFEGKIDRTILKECAIQNAKNARATAKKLVASESGRQSVKKRVLATLSESKDVSTEKLVQETIRRKSFSLAVDNILVGSAITESNNYSALNSWEGKILEDAYKILRDQLVESSTAILDNVI